MAAPTSDKDLAIRARLSSELEQMLAQAPHEQLGVSEAATESAVRARFLVIAKVYHPSRFARLSKETVKLANEVFLRYREAYDQLRADAARAPSARLRATASTRMAAASVRTRRPSLGVKQYRAENPISSRTERVDAGSARMASQRVPVRRAQTERRAATVRPRPASQRRMAEGTTQKPVVATQRPRPKSVQDLTSAIRGTERKRNEQYANALKMLAAGMTREAREAFQQLAVADPREKKYRLQFHYCLGLEHEEAGNVEEARAEFQRAINVDDTFRRAHEALDRLPKPKKKSRLSKLLGRD